MSITVFPLLETFRAGEHTTDNDIDGPSPDYGSWSSVGVFLYGPKQQTVVPLFLTLPSNANIFPYGGMDLF